MTDTSAAEPNLPPRQPIDWQEDGRPVFTKERLLAGLEDSRAKVVVIEASSFSPLATALSFKENGTDLTNLAASGIHRIAVMAPDMLDQTQKEIVANPATKIDDIPTRLWSAFAYTGTSSELGWMGRVSRVAGEVGIGTDYVLRAQSAEFLAGNIGNLIENFDENLTGLDRLRIKLAQLVDPPPGQIIQPSIAELQKRRMMEAVMKPGPGGTPSIADRFVQGLNEDSEATAQRVANLAEDGRVLLVSDTPFDPRFMKQLTDAVGIENVAEMVVSPLAESDYQIMKRQRENCADPEFAAKNVDICPVDEPPEDEPPPASPRRRDHGPRS